MMQSVATIFLIGFSGHIALPVRVPHSVIAAVRHFWLRLVLNL